MWSFAPATVDRERRMIELKAVNQLCAQASQTPHCREDVDHE
jgi:hypothetical protein